MLYCDWDAKANKTRVQSCGNKIQYNEQQKATNTDIYDMEESPLKKKRVQSWPKTNQTAPRKVKTRAKLETTLSAKL